PIVEDNLREFLVKKGANDEIVNSIISRYPRAITRTSENLQKRWNIWKSVLKSDLQVLQTLDRSPESFFRSSDLENLKENINFLSSLGLAGSTVTQLMAKAPRTFSNRATLNQDMVELLQNICICLGGDQAEEFARRIITKNIYILTRSTKRIKANIETMQSILKLPDAQMLEWIQGPGADILDLGNTYIKRNFENIYKKLRTLDCSEEEITACIFTFPRILYLSHVTFNSKTDLLLECGINVRQILDAPRVLEVSASTMQSRIKLLEQCDYDFQASGIGMLVLSSSRFKAKLEKLIHSKS
ncbi:transcription termination factor 1, mitochondrial-like, partial [Gastrophryne carolinensis]